MVILGKWQTTALLALVMLAHSVAYGQMVETSLSETTAMGEASPFTYAVLVTGVNRDPEERQAKDRALMQLRRVLLEKMQVPAENIVALVDDGSFLTDPDGASTRVNIEKALTELSSKVLAEDRFLFYYVGQANLVADTLRFNLPGPDMTDAELGRFLQAVPADKSVVVLDCPCAGQALAACLGPGRIVVCSARADQPYTPRFSEFFVPALCDPVRDTDRDGKITLLEVFRYAAAEVDDLYRGNDLLKTETPILDDDGDGVPHQRPWQYEEHGADGAAAAAYVLCNVAR